MSGDILETIDGALADWAAGPDAMRWNPEAGDTEARCRNSAEFSLEMLLPAPAIGLFDVHPAAVTPAIAGIREGHTLLVDGRVFLVTRRTVNPDGGGWTFDLEAFGP